MTRLQDHLQLLLAGAAYAGIAWTIFHFARADAWTLILALTLAASTVENARLRRENKKLRDKAAEPG